ncbi:MAG: 3-oxoacyl-ACP reductase FabG [bacterium]|nr:3-oxoacyl-ACP reductase FabG [bacterium]
MDLRLKGKSAVVTGGSRGIGSAIAIGLAKEGCNIAINYLGPDNEAEDVIQKIKEYGCKALAIKSDASNFHDAQKMVDSTVNQLEGLDIMVCNAGINWDNVIWKMSEEQFDRVIDVNLKGYFNYNRAAAGFFKDQRSGKIVNIASINGMRGKFGQTNYSASKGGIIAMSKTLARELGKFNVNVNVVAPGMVKTEMAEKLPPEFLTKAIDETVTGRIATPEECADVVVFLCSDRSRHITGEVIRVDGGQYI